MVDRVTVLYLAWRSGVIRFARAMNINGLVAWGNPKVPIRIVAKVPHPTKIVYVTKESSMGVNPSRRYLWR